MSACRWDDAAQRWAVAHLEWAGNLAAARREGSLTGSEPSVASTASSSGGSSSGASSARTAMGGLGADDGGVLHGGSERLSDVYFSYADAPGSPGRRPGTAAGGGAASPPAGRPRTAALASRVSLRPFSALGARQWG